MSEAETEGAPPRLPGPRDNARKAKALYEAAGLVPLPLYDIEALGCGCGMQDCPSPGKHPPLKAWQRLRPDVIGRDYAWRKHDKRIGLRMGRQPNGWFLIAVDDDGGLAELEAKLGPLPRDVEQKTGKGSHLFFRLPEGHSLGNSSKTEGAAVDVRGEGGFVVAAPSLHANGNRYTWLADELREPPFLPPAWLTHFETPREPKRATKAKPQQQRKGGTSYAERALHGELDNVRASIKGNRHTTLFAAAAALGELCAGGVLDEGEVRAHLREVARDVYGSEWGVRGPNAEACIEDGLTRGKSHPRYAPERTTVRGRAGGSGPRHRAPAPREGEGDFDYLDGGSDESDVDLDDLEPGATMGGEAVEPGVIDITTGKPRLIKPRAVVVPLDKPARHDITTDWLPEPIRLWCEAVSVALRVPRVLPVASALCSIAALVQGRSLVRIKPGWEEPLCLYWLVFSPTGTRKSEVLKRATAPVRYWQAEMAAKLEAEGIRARSRQKRLEYRRDRLQRQRDLDENEQRQLDETLLELRELKIPKAPQLLDADINPTVLPRALDQNRAADGIARMAVLDSEGTFLANMLGRHMGGQAITDLLLKAYQGEPVDQTRKNPQTGELMRVQLPHAYLTLLLLLQPHHLEKLRGKPELSDSGMIARCLFSECDAQPLPDWNQEGDVPRHVQEAYDETLLSMTKAGLPEVVDLTPLGDELGRHYAQHIARTRQAEGAAPGWYNRAFGRACRVIALCHLAGGKVDVGKIIGAIIGAHEQLARQVERPTIDLPPIARRVLEMAARSPGQPLVVRAVMRTFTLRREQLQPVLDLLVDTGHLEQGEVRKHRGKEVVASYRVVSTCPEGEDPGELQRDPDDPDSY
jgi:hypothetical protein